MLVFDLPMKSHSVGFQHNNKLNTIDNHPNTAPVLKFVATIIRPTTTNHWEYDANHFETKILGSPILTPI